VRTGDRRQETGDRRQETGKWCGHTWKFKKKIAFYCVRRPCAFGEGGLKGTSQFRRSQEVRLEGHSLDSMALT
jgi:hypothetical protein